MQWVGRQVSSYSGATNPPSDSTVFPHQHQELLSLSGLKEPQLRNSLDVCMQQCVKGLSGNCFQELQQPMTHSPSSPSLSCSGVKIAQILPARLPLLPSNFSHPKLPQPIPPSPFRPKGVYTSPCLPSMSSLGLPWALQSPCGPSSWCAWGSQPFPPRAASS